MDFLKSTDLVVQKESLLSEALVAGAFVYSKRFIDKPEQVYAVIQRMDITSKLTVLTVNFILIN